MHCIYEKRKRLLFYFQSSYGLRIIKAILFDGQDPVCFVKIKVLPPGTVVMNCCSQMVGALNRLLPKKIRSRQCLNSEESRQTGLETNYAHPLGFHSKPWALDGTASPTTFKKGIL